MGSLLSLPAGPGVAERCDFRRSGAGSPSAPAPTSRRPQRLTPEQAQVLVESLRQLLRMSLLPLVEETLSNLDALHARLDDLEQHLRRLAPLPDPPERPEAPEPWQQRAAGGRGGQAAQRTSVGAQADGEGRDAALRFVDRVLERVLPEVVSLLEEGGGGGTPAKCTIITPTTTTTTTLQAARGPTSDPTPPTSFDADCPASDSWKAPDGSELARAGLCIGCPTAHTPPPSPPPPPAGASLTSILRTDSPPLAGLTEFVSSPASTDLCVLPPKATSSYSSSSHFSSPPSFPPLRSYPSLSRHSSLPSISFVSTDSSNPGAIRCADVVYMFPVLFPSSSSSSSSSVVSAGDADGPACSIPLADKLPMPCMQTSSNSCPAVCTDASKACAFPFAASSPAMGAGARPTASSVAAAGGLEAADSVGAGQNPLAAVLQPPAPDCNADASDDEPVASGSSTAPSGTADQAALLSASSAAHSEAAPTDNAAAVVSAASGHACVVWGLVCLRPAGAADPAHGLPLPRLAAQTLVNVSLRRCIGSGELRAVEWLLRLGAEASVGVERSLVRGRGRADVVRALLRRGADALLRAVAAGDGDGACVALVLAHGVAPAGERSEGGLWTPLYVARHPAIRRLLRE